MMAGIAWSARAVESSCERDCGEIETGYAGDMHGLVPERHA